MRKKTKYRFSKNSIKFEALIRTIDIIGRLFTRAKDCHIKANDFNSVCFVQLAHIGDLILTVPTLYAFKNILNKKVFVAVNSENEQLAKSFNFIDKVFVIEHPSFDRQRKNYLGIVKQFKDIHADLIFELRGDLRIIPFLSLLSRHRYLIGYDVGGGGFLLDKTLQYPFGEHITKTYERIFDVFNISGISPAAEWDFNALSSEMCRTWTDTYICINVSVGASAREWEANNFVQLTRLLSKNFNIMVIGKTGPHEEYYYSKSLHDLPSVMNLINKTSLMQSIHIVKNAALFIGLETGFSHISLLMGKKTLALYSDATDLTIWGPIELFPNQLAVIKKNVFCGNCGKLKCDDNLCMKNIKVEEVFQKAFALIASNNQRS